MQCQHEHLTEVGVQEDKVEKIELPLPTPIHYDCDSRYKNSNGDCGHCSTALEYNAISTTAATNQRKNSGVSMSEELDMLQARLDRAKKMVMNHGYQKRQGKEYESESVVLTPSPFKSRVGNHSKMTRGRHEEYMVEERYSSERHWKVYERFSKVLQDASKEFDMNYVDDSS